MAAGVPNRALEVAAGSARKRTGGLGGHPIAPAKFPAPVARAFTSIAGGYRLGAVR